MLYSILEQIKATLNIIKYEVDWLLNGWTTIKKNYFRKII